MLFILNLIQTMSSCVALYQHSDPFMLSSNWIKWLSKGVWRKVCKSQFSLAIIKLSILKLKFWFFPLLLNHTNEVMHWLGKIFCNLSKRNPGKFTKCWLRVFLSWYFDFVHISRSLSQEDIELAIRYKYLKQNIIIINKLLQRRAFEFCLISRKLDPPIEKIKNREKLLSLHQPVKSILTILLHKGKIRIAPGAMPAPVLILKGLSISRGNAILFRSCGVAEDCSSRDQA
jgi:hypothetical protein